MGADTYFPEESLGFMTITAYRLLHSTLRRRLREAGLDMTPEQWGLLVLLWERGSATQDELAHAICADKASISRVLSLMEERGLITRQVDAANERRKIISAAPDALALREQGFAISLETLRGAAAGLDPEDVVTCLRVLATVKRNLRTGAG
jgi:MarR family transcriptional regulator for hemolysin